MNQPQNTKTVTQPPLPSCHYKISVPWKPVEDFQTCQPFPTFYTPRKITMALFTWPAALPVKGLTITRIFPSLLLTVPLVTSLSCVWLLINDVWTKVFFTLFTLRYFRFFGHVLGSWMYRPALIRPDPSFTRNDVTVILPTIDPHGPDFRECVESILVNNPACILVVTVGAVLREECQTVLRKLSIDAPYTQILVAALPEPSKRRQITHAMPNVTTAITIFADDHVFWPRNFIPSVLAPFEDQNVGMVATKKRVRRTTPGVWSWPSIVNFIACNYLQRHNWELRASNAIDGGVFVISGRTAVYRTDFLKDSHLLQRFCHEKFFFGLFGRDGLGPDDDNFLTREGMKKHWLVKFQDTEDATIETTLGEWPKFKDQLLRWARTTFRSNPVMLRDPDFFSRYTWSCFMVYWTGLVNFAIIWDVLLITTCILAEKTGGAELVLFLIFMFLTKITKIIPQFLRHPEDFPLVGCQILFGYVHSFIKLWALVTFWDCDWSGRNLNEVNPAHAGLDTSFFEI
ncbi:capsule polysaccharide synthase Cps1 [Fusarium beomiforme]|uniref:Capsule polysaccharide synthase Cps1 n=1 Tax=Fusarium beomiforme TaxID=44412 RepID=A0A9P5DYK6_9HYPO|nr:capsule polysaccharide synthase Cps1 [Fusarium beomiforme]